MWHSLKSYRYGLWAGGAVVIKQWFVHELCGGEQTYVQFVYTVFLHTVLFHTWAGAFHARVRASVPGLGGLKEAKLFLPHPRVKLSIVGSLRDREVACSASDRQGSNFESYVWRAVSSHSSHHPQEVLLAQFSLYVHKGGLKPDSFHFICSTQYLLHSDWLYTKLFYTVLLHTDLI